jgi:hypothetical protein
VPGSSGAEHPQDAVEDSTAVLPRPAASVRTSARSKQRLEDLPLRVSEVHVVEYDGPPLFVHKPEFGFMR